MSALTANGITIEYERRGAGEPLLMVMGLGGQLIDWPEALLDALVGRGFEVITFDNRDAGRSSEIDAAPPTRGELAQAFVSRRWARAPYRIADMARDAAALIEALGFDSVHVAGMSMGGMIAQQLVVDHPSLVRSLTSIMSSTGNRRVGRPTMRVVSATVRSSFPNRDEAVKASVEFFRRVQGPKFDTAEVRQMVERSVARSFRPAGTIRQTAAIMASPDRTAALGRIGVPSLVIHGMLDPLVRPSGGVATARAIPGSRLVMFNDMGHDLPANRLDEIADEIAAVAGVASLAGRQLTTV